MEGRLAHPVKAGWPIPAACPRRLHPPGGAGAGAEGSTVELDFDCGPLDVGTAAGPGWSLTYRRDVEPRIDESPERLRVVSPEGAFLGRGAGRGVAPPAGRPPPP